MENLETYKRVMLRDLFQENDFIDIYCFHRKYLLSHQQIYDVLEKYTEYFDIQKENRPVAEVKSVPSKPLKNKEGNSIPVAKVESVSSNPLVNKEENSVKNDFCNTSNESIKVKLNEFGRLQVWQKRFFFFKTNGDFLNKNQHHIFTDNSNLKLSEKSLTYIKSKIDKNILSSSSDNDTNN